jgi:hypothetical protein
MEGRGLSFCSIGFCSTAGLCGCSAASSLCGLKTPLASTLKDGDSDGGGVAGINVGIDWLFPLPEEVMLRLWGLGLGESADALGGGVCGIFGAFGPICALP